MNLDKHTTSVTVWLEKITDEYVHITCSSENCVLEATARFYTQVTGREPKCTGAYCPECCEGISASFQGIHPIVTSS